MITTTGDKARELLRDLKMDIFTIEKSKYFKINNTYTDMRNTSTAKVDEVINCIMTVPNRATSEMRQCLQESSVDIQSFVFDRFLYADEYFEQAGRKEIFLEENTMDFLRQCLIDFWEDRERLGAWA
jgi:hypothetical protein